MSRWIEITLFYLDLVNFHNTGHMHTELMPRINGGVVEELVTLLSGSYYFQIDHPITACNS